MADVKNYMIGNDQNTIKQIAVFTQSAAYSDSKIRIMPDAHCGVGAVIGSTMTYQDKIVPGTVGVDIACRVTGFCLGRHLNVDLEELDKICNEVVPTGFSVRQKEAQVSVEFPYEFLYCWDELRNHDRLRKSMGTLGGGNHYIELDYDENNDEYWFVVHCGSRNLGKQVAEYYQNLAIKTRDERIATYEDAKKGSIAIYRAMGQTNLIQEEIEFWNNQINAEPSDDLCYLEGAEMNHYLHDMELCNEFSRQSHFVIYHEVAALMGWPYNPQYITCIHNYVDVDHGLIRKGAIAGYKGQLGLIPLNMRDGILIVCALGNEDWNCSLPHGAGRLMSRGEARRSISLDDFKNVMEGIYSSSVVQETLDESPMAYKDAQQIIEAIKPNAQIISHMMPVWNFKAH